MNLLTVKGICKAYTDKILLDGADFSINSEDKIGIVGTNGTGKSTLLRMIAGIEQPDDGELAKGNQVKIVMLLQDPVFEADQTVYEYVLAGNDEGRAQQMLNKLGFEDYSATMGNLSGGQKKKAALARTLLTECDILVLDEPTNHLDQDVILWLENYLIGYKGALVIVTHDRYFLDRVCNRIVEVDKGHLYGYQSNFSGFLELKAEREEMELATYKKHRNILRKELEWVKRGAKARTTKQKARLDRYEILKNEKAPETTGTVEMGSTASRMGRKTMELSHIAKSYEGNLIVPDFSYIFLKNDRIGIIGPNGCGKSTLMNLIAGRLAPDVGEREVGTTLRIGYFAQDNQALDENQKVIDYIRDVAEYITIGNETVTAAAMLERFLFEGALQYQKIRKLSGGEKRRLYLLHVLMGAPNFLLLDEPTNDLDIQTLAILEDYLDDFSGIVVTVSHDRFFLDRIVDRIFAFENGQICQYEGNFTDYQAAGGCYGLGEMAKTAAKSTPSTAADSQAKTKRPAHEQKLKFTFKEQREYETIESDIEAIENRIAEIDAQMSTCATDFVKLNTLTIEKSQKEQELEEKMERYVYLSDLADKIAAQ